MTILCKWHKDMQPTAVGSDESDCDVCTPNARVVELELENKALLNLLREARHWMNDRVGDCWKCHDAVNTGLFDAIDAAIRVPSAGPESK